MNEVQLRLDAGQEALGPQLSEAVIPEHILAKPQAPILATSHHAIAVKAKALSQTAPVARPKAKWLAKAKSILHKAKPPKHEPDAQAVILAKVAQKDEVKTVAAAPKSESTQASTSELNTLQSLHQRLRGQFLLAMTTQPQKQDQQAEVMLTQAETAPAIEMAPESPTLEKAAVEVLPEPNGFHSLRRKKPHPRKKVQIAETIELNIPSHAPAASDEVTTQDVAAQDNIKNGDQEKLQELDDSFKSQLEDQIHAIQAAPQNDYSVQAVTSTATKHEITSEQGESEPASGKILVSSGSQTVWVPSTSVQPSSNKGGATVNTQNHPIAKANAPTPHSHDEVQDPGPSTVLAMTTHGARNLLNALADTQSTADYSTLAVISQLPVAHIDGVKFSEAFDWVSPVSGGYQAYVSKEFGSQGASWILSQAQDHWPTLSRRVDFGVPMISRNTSKLLSALSGAALQTEAGIVFGKLPAGWSVRLSGRSERPVFLNERNQTISPSNLEGERYFAFLNVAPGAHLMYLADSAGSEEGAIGIAVLGGVATYTDLSVIKKTIITGRVFDGSDFSARPLNGVTVRVLGASNNHAETARSGRFTIDNVLTVGDYPIYVETDAPSGYTHRYQFAPNALKDVALYRLSDSTIQTWVSQLEGAISPDSGIVVAAVPRLIKGQSLKAKLAPSVQTLAPNPTLRPEVYTLSGSGQMQVGQSLDAQNARFVSVQIPEGPAIARIIDSEKSAGQNLIWSDMIMVSPAVINVVGLF